MTSRTLLPDLQRFARIGHADRQGVITIEPRRIYILPSRYGLMFSLLVAVVLIASINSGSNLGFLTGFLLAAIGLVSMVLTWWNLVNLKVTPLAPEPVFAGSSALFPLRLHNARRQSRPGLVFSDAGSNGLYAILDLDAGSDATLEIQLHAGRRGIIRPGRLKLYSYYPLGLFQAWSYLRTEQACIVFPAPANEAPRMSGPQKNKSHSGELGRGSDDFIGHRYYREGDSLQHIDWKVAARQRGLFCKLFGGDRADQLCLDWDALPGVGTEARLQLLSRAILDAGELGLDYSLKLPGRHIEASFGKTHQLRCLTALALYGQDDAA